MSCLFFSTTGVPTKIVDTLLRRKEGLVKLPLIRVSMIFHFYNIATYIIVLLSLVRSAAVWGIDYVSFSKTQTSIHGHNVPATYT